MRRWRGRRAPNAPDAPRQADRFREAERPLQALGADRALRRALAQLPRGRCWRCGREPRRLNARGVCHACYLAS